MSYVRSTSDMAQELVRRIPMGIDTNFAIKQLNLAYRWLHLKGPWVWDLDKTNLEVLAGATTINLNLYVDIGRPMFLSGPLSSPGATNVGNLGIEIPYKPWSQALKMQYSYQTAQPGMYSCWSMYRNWPTSTPPPTSYVYTIVLYPTSAAPTSGTGTFTLPFVYHTFPVYNLNDTIFTPAYEWPLASDVFFPSANDFDDIIILRAESEARRIYGLQGWMEIRKECEVMLELLADQYRSTKDTLAGLADQVKVTNEIATVRQQ